jgi:hypothetical protein
MRDDCEGGAAAFEDASPIDLAVGAHRLTIYASGADRRDALFALSTGQSAHWTLLLHLRNRCDRRAVRDA